MNESNRVKLVQALFALKGIVWVAFAAIYFATQNTQMPAPTLIIVAALLLVDAALYLVFGWAIGWLMRWITLLALLFIVGNTVLTITDEFGLFDLFVLVVDSVIVLLIVRDWQLFWASGNRKSPSRQ